MVLLSEPISTTANSILGAFAGMQLATAKAVQRAEYLGLLKRFDWQADFSEDMRVVRAASEQFRRIRELQPHVDADKALFFAHRRDVHGSPTL